MFTPVAWLMLSSHSHSGYPHLGTSATAALITVLSDLSAATWPVSELLGNSTFNIGTVAGGEAHNILAPSARALCEVRMVSDLPGVKTQISDIAARHMGVEVKWVFEYPEALLEWHIDGFEAQPVAFGTDVPRLNTEMCGRRVLYGPGSILVAHGDGEYITAGELVESVAGYKQLVMYFIGEEGKERKIETKE
jgi:acetylornithine deacetylase